MQRPKKKFDFLQLFAESDPESARAIFEITGRTPAQLVQEIREDYATGRSREQPWRWNQCHSWLDAWLYIYRRIRLDYHQHMLWEGESIRRVVLRGRDFDDNVVGLLERFRRKFGRDPDLEELRFIENRITTAGVKRLRRLFPKAKVSRYSGAEIEKRPRLSYADPAEAAKMFPDAV